MSIDVCTTLQRLVMASEAAIAHRDPGVDAVSLFADVLTWNERPADRERVVHDYSVACANAVVRASQLRHAAGGDIYRRIVGVILPDVRADFGKALEQRRTPSP